MSPLDTFTKHYLAAALQLCDEELGTDATAEQLAPEARAKIVADCTAFQEQQKETLEAAYNWFTGESDDAPINQYFLHGNTEPFDAQAGTDFWLSRNGHGAGFFDRGKVYGGHADRLQEAAEAYGASDLYRGDDRQIYCAPA